MLSPSDIHAEFDRVRGVADFRSVADPDAMKADPLNASSLQGPHAQRMLDRTARILDEHAEFSNRFDFWWAVDAASYTDPVEVFLQQVLIAALADSKRDHPHLRALKPTAVRCVYNPQFSSFALPGQTVDFVCISIGFMKFLQVLLGAMIDFHDAGCDLTGPTRLCYTNLAFGQDAERLMRQRPKVAQGICNRVVLEGLRCFKGDFANHHSPIFGRMVGDLLEVSGLTPLLYSGCEGFIVCHELAHLLSPDKTPQRKMRLEQDADLSAISLMFVATCVIDNDLFVPTLYGPPLFFQAARIYGLIHRAGIVISGVPQDMEKMSDSEVELIRRLMGIRRYLRKETPLPAGTPDLFDDLIAELSMLLLGCQWRLLELGGKDVDIGALMLAAER